MSKEASGANASAGADAAADDKLYENRGPKTIIRLMTVGAYMFSVSFAALLLSGYYIFLWQPPNSRLIHAHAAHLRADSHMDFMAADSLTVIQVNKSNQSVSNQIFSELEANDRYKYISSSVQDAVQNQRFTQDNEGRQHDYENNGELKTRKNTTVNKLDSNTINYEEETSDNIPVTMNEKNATIQTIKFSTNTTIYDKGVKANNSISEQKLREESSKSRNKRFKYSNSEDMKIFKKFFKIL